MATQAPTSVSLQEKMKARRRVMQDLRGNRSNMKTLDQVNGLPQGMQMAAARQVGAKGAKKAKAKTKAKPSVKPKVKPDTAEQVAQSTADMVQRLRQVDASVLQTVVDQCVGDVVKMLTPEQAQHVDIAATKAETLEMMKQVIDSGNLPDKLDLQNIVRQAFHKKIGIPQHFDHGEDTGSNTTGGPDPFNAAQTSAPTGALPPTS